MPNRAFGHHMSSALGTVSDRISIKRIVLVFLAYTVGLGVLTLYFRNFLVSVILVTIAVLILSKIEIGWK